MNKQIKKGKETESGKEMREKKHFEVVIIKSFPKI